MTSSTSGGKSLLLQLGPGSQASCLSHSCSVGAHALPPVTAPLFQVRTRFMLLVNQAAAEAPVHVHVGLWGYTTTPAVSLQKKMKPEKTGDRLSSAHVLTCLCAQWMAARRTGLLHRSWRHSQTSHQCKPRTDSQWPAPRGHTTTAQPRVPLPLGGSGYMRQTLPRLQSHLLVSNWGAGKAVTQTPNEYNLIASCLSPRHRERRSEREEN